MKTTRNYSKYEPPITAAERGFTIVEVLIVLSIAGLIMLIVFQVIPSLERASRNSQRKQDVGVILDAVSQYELRDSGNFPLSCGGTTIPTPPDCSTAYATSKPDPNPNDYFLQYSQNNLTYYTAPGAVQINPESSGASVPVNSNTETVQVYDFEKCDTNSDGGATSVGADYSDVVALFSLEAGNGAATPLCQDL